MFMKYNIKEILPFSSLIKEIRGRFGNYVFYMRGGKICARKYITPPNPRTAEQQKGRILFAETVKEWKALDQETKERWNAAAEPLKKYGYSLFISVRMKAKMQQRPKERAPEPPVRETRRHVRVVCRGAWYGISAATPAFKTPHRSLFTDSS